MKISDIEDRYISMVFPYYNREKSELIFIGGSLSNGHGFSGALIVHIYRKGNFRIDCEWDYKTPKVKKL